MFPPNPFRVGGPVQPADFRAREAEVYKAVNQIRNGHLAIFGESGAGKSSLLRYLMSPLPWQSNAIDHAPFIFVYLDCTELQPFTAAACWRWVLERMREAVEGDDALRAEIDRQLQQSAPAKNEFQRALAKIGEQQKRLVLLWDDYDYALDSHDNYTEEQMEVFLYDWRSLTQSPYVGSHFSLVVATFQRLEELGPKGRPPRSSPWYNQYLYCPLKPFTENEVDALFALMAGDLTLGQRGAILEVSGRHPALLQNACNLLHNSLHVKHVVDAVEFHREFVSVTRQYFHNAWRVSTADEQMVLMLLALARLDGRLDRARDYQLDDLDRIFSQRDRQLRSLEDRGLIVRASGEPGFAFASSIMEWWVISEIENLDDEAALRERETIFLNISNKQAEQFKGVLRQVWNHKDAIGSAAGWVGQLIGAFARALTGNPPPAGGTDK